jgi:formylglycine-generating enzyme
MNMIKISGGNFSMGSDQYGPFESPVHTVHVSDFYMDETLVTNEQFNLFVTDTNYITEAEKKGAAWGADHDGVYQNRAGLHWRSYSSKLREDQPVILISWNDAKAYAQWAGKRLPTEAEWEFAARGGLISKLYPWGDDEPNGVQSNFAQVNAQIPPTTRVKQFSPNAFGLYDMVGNVWQWCEDWFGESYYQESGGLKNPLGPSQGTTKVRRGGAWNVIQSFRLRCANRGALPPEAIAPNIGFRCAKSF